MTTSTTAALPAPRTAEVSRNTAETQITVKLNLDGTGQASLATGICFFDHMLDQIARHGLIDLAIDCAGDLHIDNLKGINAHHQCETIFKAFGRTLRAALERDPRSAGVIPSTKGSL